MNLISFLSAVAPVAPAFASRVAARALFTPRGRRSTPRGDAFLATGTRTDHVIDDHQIATWRWPAGPRVVICLHGWAGSAAQFASIAPALVARGYSVIAFDGPGHGKSSGRESSILALRNTLLAVASREGGAVSVIGHSGGAAAAMLALPLGLRAERMVFVGSPANPATLLEDVAIQMGFSPRLLAGVKRHVEHQVGEPWSTVQVLPIAATRSEPLLVVHDRGDEEVPWDDGAAIAAAWPNARLLTTESLGHRKVLYDLVVADSIARFIAGEEPP